MYDYSDKAKKYKSQSVATAISQRIIDKKRRFQLDSTVQNKFVSNYRPVNEPTTLGRAGKIGVAAAAVAAAGLGYAFYRGSGIRVNLEVWPAQLANGRLEAGVLVRASGLKEGDWVDYQISWARGAVPGFNGVSVVSPHLGQQMGQAGGWRTDQPPPGNPSPLERIPTNLRYTDQGNGTADFLYVDEIQQHANMVQGPPVDRRWWFRAIVKNSWGIPIRASNTVMIQWP